ncbi:uncharacterized protein Z520_01784 [Fonsecaea multimorphosa CBS 102226]|uniref:Secreted protein n=1 Tax=Fonsecaea multimorphosa CBS 102226 TaxID=1442371 RepID=A0A0D2K6V7_9EURO|nr:uncharacterized protein Z520_01784 [Fonsecaea multimorphosa CBS 102226]KIY01648.1 hypothetical protein Z520_01784 [Fonsecaea multimorphosa CBS 102226]
MRAFTLGLSTVAALVAFSNLVAAQAEPEITEPAVLPTSEDEVHAFTPELTPDDEYFVDESEGARLAKRTPPAGVYICNNKSWLAPCTWTKLVDSQCMSFPSDAGSSVGPPTGWQCKIYYAPNCAATNGMTDGKLTYPGTPDLGSLYNNYNKPASIKCRQCPQGSNSPCLNNNAPDWNEAIAKAGYGGANGQCSSWISGKVTHSACLPAPSIS